jgi:hypothetical protein
MISASDLWDKVEGLENWNLAGVPEQLQVAEVMVFVAYPSLTDELLAQKPAERLNAIAQQMKTGLDDVLATGKLSKGKLLKDGGRFNRVRGEVRVADIPAIAQLAFVESIRVEDTNGEQIKRRVASKRKKGYYCVKMTVAIQVEGQTKGMQGLEERYVLFNAFSEDEAFAKAKEAALSYEKPYLNSAGELVRWKVESFDDVCEVVPDNPQGLNGAEVFSILKNRKLTLERAWK